MCLALPMQIHALDGHEAQCLARGVKRRVSLFMLQDDPPAVGEWVLVHVGYALQRVSAEEAAETWALFDSLAQDSPSDA